MIVPKFILDLYRKYDNFEYLKEDLRTGFPIDDIWYQQVVRPVDELSDKDNLGLPKEHFENLINKFNTIENKNEILNEKYDGVMSEKDKAIESLLDYYHQIFERFANVVNK